MHLTPQKDEDYESNKYLLDIRQLKTFFYTRYGIVKAVDGTDLQIGIAGRQEVVGLIGESGCGKTTTALSIVRLIPSSARIIGGNIMFRSRDLLKLSEEEMRGIRGKEISMIFQDPSTYLNPLMTVGEQVGESIMQHQGVKKAEYEERAIKILEMVRIADPSRVKNYYPHQLSGGMQQRVLMAIALSCNPSLIIADEPTTNLDVTVQAQILDMLKKLMNEIDASLLLITHDLGIVADICDKVYVMYAGKIVEWGDVFTIYEKTRHPYTQGLLRSTMSIDEFKEELVSIEGKVPNLINPPSGCRFHPRCPNRKKKCSHQKPPLIEIEQDHFVYCWLYQK